MSIPVATFTAVGDASLGLICGLGAFSSLYAASRAPIERSRILAVVCVAFVLCGLAGVAASISPVLITLGLVLVATAAVFTVHGTGLGPPGPVFFVLVFGASAHIETPVEGSRSIAPVEFISLLVGGCALAWAVTAVPLLRPSTRHAPARPLRKLRPRLEFDERARRVVARSLMVVFVGAAVSVFVDDSRGYWVVCAGLAVLGIGLPARATLRRGVERVAGTLAGAGVFVGISALHPAGYLLAVALGVLQTTVEMLVVRAYGVALVFITPLALTVALSAAGGTNPVPVALERIIDTFVGTATAIAAGLLIGRHSNSSH